MNALDNLLGLDSTTLSPEQRLECLDLVSRITAMAQEADGFLRAVTEAKASSLTERWEACKSAYRAQRTVRDAAVAAAGMIDAQLLAAHRQYGEARLAVANFQPPVDRFASSEAIAEIEAHRERLQEAMATAARSIGRVEQELVKARSWAVFQQKQLDALAAEEEQLSIQIGRLKNPDMQVYNSFGLTSSRPAQVQVSSGLGLS